MGNRALIIPSEPTQDNPVVGIYVHWNGGPESVLAFLEVCKRREYRDPAYDSEYGMARLCGVIHEFFGIETSTCLGIWAVTADEWNNSEELDYLDNGIYRLGEDWTIAERRGGFGDYKAKTVEDLNEKERAQYVAIVRELMADRLVCDAEDPDA